MVSGHFHVHLADGTVERSVSVFLVHVVDSGSRVVLDDHSVCLDLVGVFLEDFVHGTDFSIGFLELVLLVHLLPNRELKGGKVPEFGLGYDVVWCENSHSEGIWVWVGFGWQWSADNQILFHLR